MDTNGVHRSRRGRAFLSFCPSSAWEEPKFPPGGSVSPGSGHLTGIEPKPPPGVTAAAHGPMRDELDVCAPKPTNSSPARCAIYSHDTTIHICSVPQLNRKNSFVKIS